ncbi:MAG: hypothetical protein NZ936_18205, partial [Alphaproteobacteria bacterium]|nr:hypothetical protein [Alphaproteobacteria bacterium]
AHYDAASNSKSQSVPANFRRRPVQIDFLQFCWLWDFASPWGWLADLAALTPDWRWRENFFGFHPACKASKLDPVDVPGHE